MLYILCMELIQLFIGNTQEDVHTHTHIYIYIYKMHSKE